MRKFPFAAAIAAIILSTTACSQQPRAPGGPMSGGMMQGGMMQQGAGARAGSDVTPGWMMMEPAERDEHRQAMLAARTPEECRKVRDEHMARMQERARARGMASMPMAQMDACADMRP